MKLEEKKRIASKIIKKHDAPKTPYQRCLDSEFVSPQSKRFLKELYKNLNPFKLRKIMDEKITKINHLAR